MTRAPQRYNGALPAVEERLAVVEADLAEHKREDEGQFARLRADMAQGFKDLGEQIAGLGKRVTAQELDQARAEGKAEGIAQAKQPHPWWAILSPLGAALLTWALAVWATHH